jgi:fructose-1,6-bisphosphatase/inositol monophosphatase family enzyme
MNVTLLLQKIQTEIVSITHEVMSLRAERTMKDDLSFVTKGDLMLNQCIERIVHQEESTIIIVSEEMVNEILSDASGYIVVVDPIDGTENFTSGLPEWGVSVSCFRNGKHIGSLLGCPEMNLWMKTGDTVPRLDELIKATQGHEYRILGCCVYNMINVIRGSFLSFENPKGAHSWDILGGLNLALEHNLKVTVNDKPYSGEYLPAGQKYRFRVEHQ